MGIVKLVVVAVLLIGPVGCGGTTDSDSRPAEPGSASPEPRAQSSGSQREQTEPSGRERRSEADASPNRASERFGWSDGFESGDFRAWSWWGQGQPELWGHVEVVADGADGVPAHKGARMARFETTPDDVDAGRIHAKVFKSFSRGRGEAERPFADQSGSYRVWYFLPTDYRVPHGTTVNVLQLKDNYRTADGDKQSDPLWWLNFGNAEYWSTRGGPGGLRGDAPVAFANNWAGTYWDRVEIVKVPLGRWIEVRADVRHGERIDFYLDGQQIATGLSGEHPVNTFHPSSINLIFGIGNYSGGANGPLYADSAAYVPFR